MPSYYSLALLFALSLAIGDALFGITFLQPDEQVLLKGLSTLTVRNGPGLKMYPPLVTRVTKRKGTTLDEVGAVVAAFERVTLLLRRGPSPPGEPRIEGEAEQVQNIDLYNGCPTRNF